MTEEHAYLVVVVVVGAGLCLVPNVSKRLPLGLGAAMVTLSGIAGIVGLEEMSVSFAEIAYYCVVIAVITVLLQPGVRRFASTRASGAPARHSEERVS